MILDAGEKPIGVQILGPRAGDLLSEWVAILNGKVKLSTLAQPSIHIRPWAKSINGLSEIIFLPRFFRTPFKKG